MLLFKRHYYLVLPFLHLTVKLILKLKKNNSYIHAQKISFNTHKQFDSVLTHFESKEIWQIQCTDFIQVRRLYSGKFFLHWTKVRNYLPSNNIGQIKVWNNQCCICSFRNVVYMTFGFKFRGKTNQLFMSNIYH